MIDIETMLFQLLHITTTINELNFPPEIKKIFYDKLNILKCMIAEASNLMKLIKNTEVNERKKLIIINDSDYKIYIKLILCQEIIKERLLWYLSKIIICCLKIHFMI